MRLSSPGPAIFKQVRTGRDGKEFTLLKFRSMYVDAEKRRAELEHRNERAEGLLFKIRDDPRVTPVGRFLRRFSLDELPQLINVMQGKMSLVGPRPPLPEEVALYQDDVRRRLLVKPGLTGLWQISGRSDLDWDESVRLDLRYVENWSFTLDLMILWKTMSRRRTGARRLLTPACRPHVGRWTIGDAGRRRPPGITHVTGARSPWGSVRNNPAIGEVDLHVDDALLAEELAERAGALLLQLRAAGADGRTGDAESDAFLLAELAARRPGDAVLSRGEPGPGRPAHRRAGLDRRPARRHPGVRRGRRATTGPCTSRSGSAASSPAGAVALPARGAVRSSPDAGPAAGPASAVRSGSRSAGPARRPWRHPAGRGARRRAGADGLGRRQGRRRARGEVDAYVHAGGQYEWDSAAPVAVARAAGLHASRIDGSPLRYNQPDPLAAGPARLPTLRWPTGLVGLPSAGTVTTNEGARTR